MANVRCPMCSKLNPPEAEVCAYCGARLKPLRPTGDLSPARGPAPQPPHDDEPDWLRQLRSDEPSSPKQPADAGQPGSGSTTDAEESSGADSNVPDWLARIRGRNQSETGEPSGPFSGDQDQTDWMKDVQGEKSPADEGLDDWINRLSGSQTTETGTNKPPDQPYKPPFTPDSEEASAPDWLQNFADEPSASGVSPFPSDEAISEDDWMGKLFTGQPGPAEKPATPAENTSSSSQPTDSGQVDDFSWLNSLKAQGETAPEQPEGQDAEPGLGLDSFLSGLETPSSASSGEGAPQAGAPQEGAPRGGDIQWDSLQGKPGEEQPGQEAPSSGFGLTGFLSSLEGTGAPQQPAETGDWSEDSFPSGAQASDAAPDQELPDWMIDGTIPSAQPESGTSETGLDATNLPDWLQNQGRASSVKPAEGEPAEETNVPDWLQGQSAEPPASEASLLQAAESDLPDWLSGPENESRPAQPPVEQPGAAPTEEYPAEAAGLPDWLSSDTTPTTSPSTEEAPVSAEPGLDLPDWFGSFEQAEDKSEDMGKTQPSRTGGLKPRTGQLSASSTPAGDEPVAEPAGEGAEQPDWLRGFETFPPADSNAAVPPLIGGEEVLASPAGESGEQPFSVDLPEWLDEDAAARSGETLEQPAETGGDELAQAELPEWVKEMRPIESIIPGDTQVTETDQRVEKAGPLAGLRGVLPAEELVAHYRKPPTYSNKLRITEKQRSQASLLDSVLTQEGQPLAIPPSRVRGQGYLLRITVALLVLAVIIATFFFALNPLAMPSPGQFPREQNMFQQIDQNQSSNAPVLLAVDYEPGLSGEMRLTASTVVEHLMAKNARLVIVSTVPSGPALATQLLDNAASNYKARSQKEYSLADQTVNLGYLPGGTVSMVDFAQFPQRAAPVSLAGNHQVWSDTFLKEITGIGSFSQVIVITDRAETGRTWVEQVQPLMNKVPLFMVTSAQAAPLLVPYLDSGQVAGLTSGLMGGAAYAQLAGQTDGPVLRTLAAYQVGMVVVFVLVLIGGVVSGGMALLRRGGKEEE